jgi:hypothetical protein
MSSLFKLAIKFHSHPVDQDCRRGSSDRANSKCFYSEKAAAKQPSFPSCKMASPILRILRPLSTPAAISGDSGR